jgi:hypothetical protein
LNRTHIAFESASLKAPADGVNSRRLAHRPGERTARPIAVIGPMTLETNPARSVRNILMLGLGFDDDSSRSSAECL